MSFSVLMSLYFKENPTFSQENLDSLERQTLKATKIVLVFDGELTNKRENTVSDYLEKLPIKVIHLPKNKGLGNALRIGVEICKNELIARMDTDDIAFSDRFEKQVKYMEENPNIDVLGGQLEEFNQVPGDLKRYRKLPSSQKDIVKFAKFRSPMNHPKVMFRKSKILEAGNYGGGLLLKEGLLYAGKDVGKRCIFNNIEDITLNFRVKDGTETIQRRKFLMQDNELKFATYAREIGFSSIRYYLKYVLIKPMERLLPIFII